MTIDEAIAQLQALSAEGKGGLDVFVYDPDSCLTSSVKSIHYVQDGIEGPDIVEVWT